MQIRCLKLIDNFVYIIYEFRSLLDALHGTASA